MQIITALTAILECLKNISVSMSNNYKLNNAQFKQNKDLIMINESLIEAIQCCCDLTMQIEVDTLAHNLYQSKINAKGFIFSAKKDYVMNQPTSLPLPEVKLIGGVMSSYEYSIREGIING